MGPGEITDEERAEWRALCEAATPGPWEWEQRGPGGNTLSLMKPQTYQGMLVHPLNLLNTEHGEWDVNGEANRALIAAARAAMPRLLASEAALREERDRLREALREALDGWAFDYEVGKRAILKESEGG